MSGHAVFGYLRTTNQIKMNFSKRYKIRNLKNPLQKLFIDGKLKNYFLASVDDLDDFMCSPCNEDENEQIRETLADAVHPSINVELSETLMLRIRPIYNIFNEIGVAKYMQRSPWLEPLSLISLGARSDVSIRGATQDSQCGF